MQDRRRVDSRPVVNRSVRMFPRAMFLAKERVEIPVGSSIAVRRLIWIPIPRLFRMRAPASIMPSSMWADLSVLALRFTDPPMECSISHTQGSGGSVVNDLTTKANNVASNSNPVMKIV